MFVHACHCRHCQRETGSAFGLNGLIERDKIDVLEGETIEDLLPTESGKGQRVIRCASCHVALWSHYAYGKIADIIAFLRVATLQEPEKVSPDIHIYTDSKLPWVLLPSDVPCVPGFYKASEMWPKESIERRTALFASLG